MPFFSNKSNKSRLLWGFTILMLLVCLFFQWQNFRQGQNFSQEVSKFAAREAKRQIFWQEVLKSPIAQTAKVELPKQATMEAANKWAKRHVFYSNAEKRCAAYKKKVYDSNIDPQLKDLLWGGAVVASEYCWEVDTQPAPVPTAKSKTAKPKQKKAESRLK